MQFPPFFPVPAESIMDACRRESGMRKERETMSNENSRAKSIFQRLYNYRLKIDRNGKPILNFSSLFSMACLIFAPHMTIAGIILSLVLGYHISLDTEQEDESLEQTLRQAADTVRKTASAAARTIHEEVEKAKRNSGANPAAGSAAKQPADTPETRAEKNASASQEAAPETAADRTEESAAKAQEIVRELEKHAEDRESGEFTANPAMYHTAYSASAGTVPTLEVHESGEAQEYTQQKKMSI